MADFFNKEIVDETNPPERQSDPQLEQMLLERQRPSQSLDSPWIISIRENLEQARQYEASPPWATLSIYRVPKHLFDFDEAIYIPIIVSLGPYHRGLKQLQDMERHKWRALHRVLARTGQDVRLYFDAARSLECRARACYEDPLHISSEAFVESLVLDSMFLIELFVGYNKGFVKLGYAADDPIFSNDGISNKFMVDLLKLENQLPLFVLDRFHGLQLGHEPSSSGLVASLAIPILDTVWFSVKLLNNAGNSEALHCLDVFHRSLLQHENPEITYQLRSRRKRIHWRWSNTGNSINVIQFVRCVTELRQAGIKFQLNEIDRFSDIRFNDGVLQMPPFYIRRATKHLLSNLVAFEQCHQKSISHITSYILFMGNLIKSEVDVEHLHSKGIIVHWFGSNREVADLFIRLFNEVVFFDDDDYCYLELSEQVNRYYNNKCNVWRASFNNKYFTNPWTFISLVGAVVLLLLTFGQTFYSIYGYYKPIK